ncbi:hypothetical protein AN958_06522 [Leucoagaricus sp. SymC.cos]|nr:hypothetical protein AN958_06522 [Leucoagaricus sp. SymC.cos]
MTRPEQMSKRKAFNKAIRARAAQEQTSFAFVLQRTQDAQHRREYRAMLNQPTHILRSERRNMMRMEHRVHDAQGEPNSEFAYTSTEAIKPVNRTVMIDLMAIARPAKVKGIAKEFEVVKRVKNVIALEDNISELDLYEDDWEEIDYDNGFKEKRTYSAALSGK